MDAAHMIRLSSGFTGVLLAGGRGERFRASAGRADADKLLATLPDGRAVAAAAAQTLLRALPAVIAVIRPGVPALRAVLEDAGCDVLETPDAVRGMGASLACAARALQAAGASMPPAQRQPGPVGETHGTAADASASSRPAGVVVALADMPWVPVRAVRAVATAAAAHRIAAPVHHGRRGHPVAFAWDLLPQLALLDGDEGARALLRSLGVHEVSCDDPGVLRDVDTVGDLR
ncbi:hypothetical protein CAL14_12850 [Bordetella genomosp. 9]|nr:hypothetical protein CAL14_12850 [Bordetella genomosp. 9]